MSNKTENNLTFEESLSKLQKISEQLESESISLDESIALFEKGIKLSKDCSEKLKNAKQKIEHLTAGSENDD